MLVRIDSDMDPKHVQNKLYTVRMVRVKLSCLPAAARRGRIASIGKHSDCSPVKELIAARMWSGCCGSRDKLSRSHGTTIIHPLCSSTSTNGTHNERVCTEPSVESRHSWSAMLVTIINQH